MTTMGNEDVSTMLFSLFMWSGLSEGVRRQYFKGMWVEKTNNRVLNPSRECGISKKEGSGSVRAVLSNQSSEHDTWDIDTQPDPPI